MRPLMFSVLFAASAVLGACELQPAPHKAPPAEPTPPPVKDPTAAAQPTPPQNPPPQNPPPQNPPPTPPQAVDAGVVVPPADAPPVSQECTDVALKIAEALIKEATDPTQKASMEQEKTNMILRTAQVCTRNAWKPEARNCFLKATTTAQMQDCAQQLGPQQQ